MCMPMKIPAFVFIITQLIILGKSADLILRSGLPACSVLISSFDPIKVEAKFPTIGSKVEGEHFFLTLTNFKTSKIEHSEEIQDNRLFRQNFYLEKNTLYQICFEFVTSRDFGENNVILVSFLAEEHFNVENEVKIPPELMGQENLQSIYDVGSKMFEFVSKSGERQKKERQIEDRLVDLSSHKTERIITITVIECGVIIFSGIYQIFALRRFLIDKNLY